MKHSQAFIEEVRAVRAHADAEIARIGRWGTCADCPRRAGRIWSEECVNTKRYDHQLQAEDKPAEVQ